ncbi:MAG: copper-binding protein, partial [Candidatus Nitrosopumilus limneticus]|nr:copper-binding protein [Candidatus Nitrosopumilus limneticus]
PITPETVSFDIVVGEASAQPINPIEQVVEETVVATQESEENGGGCLIATATYGSELAPQVQLLREIRDNQLLNTESGSAFMGTFNDIYYTFSPTIADMERQSPIFKEIVKAGLTPMLSTLSIMENANSESEVLGLGLSVIALNLGMYIGLPVIGIVKVIQFRKN